jgi:hypothetical protein
MKRPEAEGSWRVRTRSGGSKRSVLALPLPPQGKSGRIGTTHTKGPVDVTEARGNVQTARIRASLHARAGSQWHFSIIVPVSVRPVPVAPVGSRVICISVGTIVITPWVIRRPVKGRNRDRYWETETEEDPSLGPGLGQQCDSKDDRQDDNKFFHIITSTDEKCDFRLRRAKRSVSEAKGLS